MAAPEPRTVLVFDDHPEVAAVIGDIIEATGHTAVLVHDETMAAAVLDDWTFDAVVVDLRLQGRSGLDWLETVAARTPVFAARIVLTTGSWLSTENEERLNALGGSFLRKPFDARELVEVLGLPRRLAS